MFALLDKSITRSALLIAMAMAAIVATALAFEHIGGYLPCKLCLEQRTPYYLGVPVMLLAAFAAPRSGMQPVAKGLLAIGGLLMTYGLVLAVFHAGVEWAWWPGPTDCVAAATSITTNANDLLGDINAVKPPSCDKAALRILGLSFAGWNVPASLALMLVSFRAAWKA
jgi:disulfide bond formation protein DsbB